MSSTNWAPFARTRSMAPRRKPSEAFGGSEPEITRQSRSSSPLIRSNMACSSAAVIAAPAFTMLYSVSGPAFKKTFTRVMPSVQTGLTSTPSSRAPSTM